MRRKINFLCRKSNFVPLNNFLLSCFFSEDSKFGQFSKAFLYYLVSTDFKEKFVLNPQNDASIINHSWNSFLQSKILILSKNWRHCYQIYGRSIKKSHLFLINHCMIQYLGLQLVFNSCLNLTKISCSSKTIDFWFLFCNQ